MEGPCLDVSTSSPAWSCSPARLLLTALRDAAATPRAQGRLDARYEVTLAGVPIGKGAWVIDIGDDQFTAAASGATAGLMRVFASGQGSSASRGAVVAAGSSIAGDLCVEHRRPTRSTTKSA